MGEWVTKDNEFATLIFNDKNQVKFLREMLVDKPAVSFNSNRGRDRALFCEGMVNTLYDVVPEAPVGSYRNCKSLLMKHEILLVNIYNVMCMDDSFDGERIRHIVTKNLNADALTKIYGVLRQFIDNYLSEDSSAEKKISRLLFNLVLSQTTMSRLVRKGMLEELGTHPAENPIWWEKHLPKSHEKIWWDVVKADLLAEFDNIKKDLEATRNKCLSQEHKNVLTQFIERIEESKKKMGDKPTVAAFFRLNKDIREQKETLVMIKEEIKKVVPTVGLFKQALSAYRESHKGSLHRFFRPLGGKKYDLVDDWLKNDLAKEKDDLELSAIFLDKYIDKHASAVNGFFWKHHGKDVKDNEVKFDGELVIY